MGENKGHFRKGNQLWRNVDYPGNPRKYEPKTLWEKFIQYMEQNSEAMWSKEDFIKSGPGAGTKIYLDVPNPPSLGGFCVFSGITLDTFRNYGKIDAEWLAVTCMIREIVMTEQIDGATTNIFNANIIARLSGLVDRKEIDVKASMSDDERKEAIKSILEKIKKDDSSSLI